MTEVIGKKRARSKSFDTGSGEVSRTTGKFTANKNRQFEGLIKQVNDWLESHWVSPSFGSCVIAVIGLCLFAAATNIMAGWLYLISGLIAGMLILNAILAVRSLSNLKVNCLPIDPVNVDQELNIQLEIENSTKQPVNLFEVHDLLPYVLNNSKQTLGKTTVEIIPAEAINLCSFSVVPSKRGVYQWLEVKLRTAAPLGLTWCSRLKQVPAKAVVYPIIYPLTQCPLIDTLGKDESTKMQSDRRYYNASEGLTRGLRPYRLGDPTRLIHWRTSARFDELKVRELEIITGSEDVVICLDNASRWQEESFEKAVTAAASLYFYACRCQLKAHLWSFSTGVIRGSTQVLETLAAIESGEEITESEPPKMPSVWLTQNPLSIKSLEPGSRWALFPSSIDANSAASGDTKGLIIDSQEPLQQQLQKPL